MNRFSTLFDLAAIRTSMRSLIFVSALALGNSANAQQACTLVNSIAINTGYDPVAAAAITPPATDPNWYVSALAPGCTSVCACSPSFAAYSILPYSGWVTGSNSQWISFYNGTAYATDGISNYNQTLSRNFRLCNADYITFDFDIAVDNAVMQMDIDGSTVVFSQYYPTYNPANYNAFTHVTYTTPSMLSATTHIINVSIYQEQTAMSYNANGVDIEGTITSTSGSNIVGPSSPANCSCTPGCSCFDTSHCLLTGTYTGPGNTGTECEFTVNASYMLSSNSSCIFVGYAWNGGPIGPTSSMNYSVPNGTTTTVTVVLYAYDPIAGDTCTFSMVRHLECSSNGVPTVYKQSNNQTGNNSNSPNDNDIEIYPNPTDDMVMVYNKTGITDINIIDISGKTVGTYNYDNVPAANISLSGLPAGTYLFRINGLSSKAIVKIK